MLTWGGSGVVDSRAVSYIVRSAPRGQRHRNGHLDVTGVKTLVTPAATPSAIVENIDESRPSNSIKDPVIPDPRAGTQRSHVPVCLCSATVRLTVSAFT